MPTLDIFTMCQVPLYQICTKRKLSIFPTKLQIIVCNIKFFHEYFLETSIFPSKVHVQYHKCAFQKEVISMIITLSLFTFSCKNYIYQYSVPFFCSFLNRFYTDNHVFNSQWKVTLSNMINILQL